MSEDLVTDRNKLLLEVRVKSPIRPTAIWQTTKPIEFGLSALRLHVKVPISLAGGTIKVENAIVAISHVRGVETDAVSRL